MLEVDIPGLGALTLQHLVSDFTGTLSVGGRLLAGVKERLTQPTEFLEFTILTADTFGVARQELTGINCSVFILSDSSHDIQEEKYVTELGQETIVALGNRNNDRLMLKAAKIGIAVLEGEGCAVD